MRLNRRRLGKTEKRVTELAFGAMNLRRIETIKLAEDLLNFVLDSGINLIDTARVYNGENLTGQFIESEVIVGRVMKSRSDLLEPIIIVTKGHGYNPEEFDKDLQISLEKLDIEGRHDIKIGDNNIILVYFFHGINDQRWAEMKSSGVLEHAQKRKNEGLFNFIGFSSHYAQTAEIIKAIKSNFFDVCELPYNLYNRSLDDSNRDIGSILKLAADYDLGIINMKPFFGNGYDAMYKKVFKDYVSLSYIDMLRFCLSNPYISTIDAGAKYISEFKTDLLAAEKGRLTKDEIDLLVARADQVSPLLDNTCRECMHCMEKFSCPNNIDFPKILSLFTRFRICKTLEKETQEYIDEYKKLRIQADECTACGECLTWCEYKLKVPVELQKAHAVLR